MAAAEDEKRTRPTPISVTPLEGGGCHWIGVSKIYMYSAFTSVSLSSLLLLSLMRGRRVTASTRGLLHHHAAVLFLNTQTASCTSSWGGRARSPDGRPSCTSSWTAVFVLAVDDPGMADSP